MSRNLFLLVLAVTLIIPMGLWAREAKEVSSQNIKLFSAPLRKGDRGEEVRELQHILKSDPEIYPEGLTTGYFGPLTAKALKKLQAKYGLVESGVLDEATQTVIFPPQITLELIAPNGGEVWDRAETQTISWKTTIAPIKVGAREILPEARLEPGRVVPPTLPFFLRASLDLIRDSDASFRYHLATVDLYQSQYRWRIPGSIPAGDDYRVQISAGSHVVCLYQSEVEKEAIEICPPWRYPDNSASDKSDNPFSISGTAPPSREIIAQLKAQVIQIEHALEKLMREIQSLKALIESL